ncbi:hypothetical protein F4604DRAFT_1925613 [Suillus subluteus]|nr:hypothetical protein F4604DRAFT_1925613 [Suillus subluteus]
MGLADLAEEPGEDESLEGEEEQGSFDVVDWEDSAPEYSAPPTIIEESVTEYETLPAVGGGTITRRVYTIPKSMTQTPSETSHLPDAASVCSDPQSRLSHPTRFFHWLHSKPGYDIPSKSLLPRPITPSSLETQFSSSSGVIDTPPSSIAPLDTTTNTDADAPLESPLSSRHLSLSLSSSSNLNCFDTRSTTHTHHRHGFRPGHPLPRPQQHLPTKHPIPFKSHAIALYALARSFHGMERSSSED